MILINSTTAEETEIKLMDRKTHMQYYVKCIIIIEEKLLRIYTRILISFELQTKKKNLIKLSNDRQKILTIEEMPRDLVHVDVIEATYTKSIRG